MAKLKSISPIYFCSQLQGEYPILIAICCRSHNELMANITNIYEQLPGLIKSHEVSTRICITHFDRRFLWDQNQPRQSFTMGLNPQLPPISQDQLRILASIGSSAGKNILEVSRQIKLPHNTVRYNLRKLFRAKIVVGSFYSLNLFSCGIFPYRVLIKVTGNPQQIAKILLKHCQASPNIITFIQTMGIWQFELGVDTQKSQDILLIVSTLKKLLNAFSPEITPIQVKNFNISYEFLNNQKSFEYALPELN